MQKNEWLCWARLSENCWFYTELVSCFQYLLNMIPNHLWYTKLQIFIAPATEVLHMRGLYSV